MKEPDDKPRREYTAPALERAIDILEMLADRSTGMTISEIAQALGRSISEVFRIILVMERRYWLQKVEGSDRYRTSYWMLDVAYRGTPAQSLANIATPVMAELANATNQSCHLVIRAESRGLVIHRQENAGPSGFAMRAGAVIDLVVSCSGHVLLAFETEERRAAVIAGLDRPSRSAVRALEPRLKAVRAQGFERQPSARTGGVTDISVPIHGLNGTIVAALTIPYLELIDEAATISLEDALSLLLKAGRRISGALGSHDHPAAGQKRDT